MGLTVNERAAIAKVLRAYVHRTPELQDELDYYNRLLDNFVALGSPIEADDQNALRQLLIDAGFSS